MSYIITFFDREGPGRRYLFPKPSYANPAIEVVTKMMDWLEDQPITRAMRGQQVPFAWTPEYQSSITVRDLNDDEIVLLQMAGTPNIRIVHESRLHRRLKPIHGLSTEGTAYRRDIAKKRDPSTYDVVKRRSRRL